MSTSQFTQRKDRVAIDSIWVVNRISDPNVLTYYTVRCFCGWAYRAYELQDAWDQLKIHISFPTMILAHRAFEQNVR